MAQMLIFFNREVHLYFLETLRGCSEICTMQVSILMGYSNAQKTSVFKEIDVPNIYAKFLYNKNWGYITY